MFVCGWKLASELLYIAAKACGAWWELIKRGSGSAAPLLWIGFQRVLGIRSGRARADSTPPVALPW